VIPRLGVMPGRSGRMENPILLARDVRYRFRGSLLATYVHVDCSRPA
jgi:hypothetical protein